MFTPREPKEELLTDSCSYKRLSWSLRSLVQLSQEAKMRERGIPVDVGIKELQRAGGWVGKGDGHPVAWMRGGPLHIHYPA